MFDPGDEPPFPEMSPDVEELSDEALERQARLKQEAADALEDGRRDLALEKLTEAISLGRASALMYSRRGQLLLSLGRPFAAINDCTAALLIDSEVASAFKTRARALSRLEQWREASADFSEALRLDHDDATYRESLEALAREQSSAPCSPGEQLAVTTTTEANEARPEANDEGDEPPFLALSPIDIAELTAEALDEQTGLKQESKDALEDGDVDIALEKISEAIALGCASASMYCMRAELLLLLSRPRAAVNDCGAALAIDPEACKAFEVRGKAFAELQRWDDAHSNFLEALRLGGGEATRQAAEAAKAHLGLGDSAEDGEGGELVLPMETGGEPPFPPMAPPGTVDLTDVELERQAQLKEQSTDAMEAGDEGLALRSMTEAITMGGASALMYCRRANILLQLDRPRAAINDCRAALALNAGSTKALKLRARASAALEWWADAENYYTQALAIEDDGVVREELQAVKSRIQDIQRESALAARRRWEIVGGADKGGVVVRTGLDVSSPQALDPLDGVTPYRLSSGAVVAEIELVGDRLHYQKLNGSGPREGWISITFREKVLAIPVAVTSSSLTVQGDGGNSHLEDVPGEEPPFPSMAPPRVESLTEAQQDRQAELKQQATDALESGDEQLALEKLTAAIVLGCSSALMYCRRAHILLQLNRPRAAVNDCTAALTINPDSGKAFKIRARAHAKLRHWPEAHSDFQEGLRIDYDEDTYEESLSVESKMKGMKAIATEKRLQVEEKRRVAEEKELEQLKVQAEMALAQHKMQVAQQKAKQDLQTRKLERMYMSDQYGQIAWQQGYMTDFMGVKRGKCNKCKTCPVYCWTPVRMSS